MSSDLRQNANDTNFDADLSNNVYSTTNSEDEQIFNIRNRLNSHEDSNLDYEIVNSEDQHVFHENHSHIHGFHNNNALEPTSSSGIVTEYSSDRLNRIRFRPNYDLQNNSLDRADGSVQESGVRDDNEVDAVEHYDEVSDAKNTFILSLQKIEQTLFFFEARIYAFYYMLFYFSFGKAETKRSIGKDSYWGNESTNFTRQQTRITSPTSDISTSSSSRSQSPFIEKSIPISRFFPLKILSIFFQLLLVLWRWIDQWIDVVCLIFNFLQMFMLIVVPVQSWSKRTKRWIVRLGFLRSFQLEMLFLDPIDYSHSIDERTALWLNFYGPIIFSFLYIIFLLANFLQCFILSQILQNKVVEKFLGLKYYYLKISFLTLSLQFRLLPLLYIPILNNLLLAISCNLSWYSRLEIIPSSCWNTENFMIALTSIFLLAPFILTSLVGIFGVYDWRPDTKNVCGRPHTRFDLIFFAFITCMTVTTHFLEQFHIVVLFFDFISMLALLGFHMYFMQWYKIAVNQFVASVLFLNMFACLISLLVSVFHLIFSFFEYSFTNFPGAVLFTMIPISIVCGKKMTTLRLNVIKISLSPLSAPRPLQLLYNIEPTDVIIPRGEFEIEMATRSLDVVKYIFGESSNSPSFTRRRRIQALSAADASNEYAANEDILQQELEEKVRDMYQNAMDVSNHFRSEYIHVSYGSYLAHIMNDLRMAIQLAETAQSTRLILFPDIRMMYYIRQRYWQAMLLFYQRPIPMNDFSNEPSDPDVRNLTQLHLRRVRDIEEEARQYRHSVV